jgi:hypothetical protein
MQTTALRLFSFALIAAAALLLPACATTKPSPTTVSVLGAAGFRLRTPETPKQKEIFATLPSYKVEGIVVKGRKYYVYKDEGKGMALIGGEAEYQRYRELAKQERQSATYERVRMSSAAEAESWYGASGSDWWR